MTIDPNYWKHYYDAETVARSDARRHEVYIPSTGVNIHIDTYPQADSSAPVFIFNHGAGGYSRLFVPLALAMHDLGYTVVLPDQRGQGYSEGDRGDFTLRQAAQNIIDAAAWARAEFSGPIIMAGGSLGSGLAYIAASAPGSPADLIVAHNLYDFSEPSNSLALSRFAPVTQLPLFPAISGVLIWSAMALAPGLRVPFRLLGKFEAMFDARDVHAYQTWLNDPAPIKSVTLRYMHSTFSTAPAVPLEANRLPILVINPVRDEMVDPAVTRANYDRLGGPKQYAAIDYGHWATGETFIREYTTLIDGYIRQQLALREATA